ncbi:MAG TPA: peptidylprolyl isomerase [Phycisphaerales bacterium]
MLMRAIVVTGVVMVVGSMLAGCRSKEHVIHGESVPRDGKVVTAILETSAGDITLELDRERAPLSVDNFVRHAKAGHYDNTVFQRVISNFVIQGGSHTPELMNLPASDAAARTPGEPLGLDRPIKNEWQNGLKNVKGSVGLGRDTDPDSGTREFYINVVDNPRLDTPREISGGAGYAVFGRVTDSWDAVEKIRTGVTGSRAEKIRKNGELVDGEMMKDVPLELVVVKRVRIVGDR